ncbi:predicted protein [Phaeodactylum tricornutum CCAP 1055/1]|uniref:EF-hand domain-containing protein n=1 Tax=Phaeodactylum tricornutum (strain CCAP 1055/1) TaxID=556484 RepID=B7GC64_PHATC|nr:predicted protein [Phaeodactylum tricornutum CCAP 1055/1]EEC43723.1 predicted protein [Phaeodactylum tricornutum CCAP 1055/1]|eukprot:XP_002184664.1 predicted protein [Phaeodactylum tricornutum CCAP 1055/1]
MKDRAMPSFRLPLLMLLSLYFPMDILSKTDLSSCMEAMQLADQNRDGLISRSEYVNLMTTLSPYESCPDSRLGGDLLGNGSFHLAFSSLACLCLRYTNDRNCCTEAGEENGTGPVLVLGNVYPKAYTERVCATLAGTLDDECAPPPTLSPAVLLLETPVTAAAAPTAGRPEASQPPTVSPNFRPSSNPTAPPRESILPTPTSLFNSGGVEDGGNNGSLVDANTDDPNRGLTIALPIVLLLTLIGTLAFWANRRRSRARDREFSSLALGYWNKGRGTGGEQPSPSDNFDNRTTCTKSIETPGCVWVSELKLPLSLEMHTPQRSVNLQNSFEMNHRGIDAKTQVSLGSLGVYESGSETSTGVVVVGELAHPKIRRDREFSSPLESEGSEIDEEFLSEQDVDEISSLATTSDDYDCDSNYTLYRACDAVPEKNQNDSYTPGDKAKQTPPPHGVSRQRRPSAIPTVGIATSPIVLVNTTLHAAATEYPDQGPTPAFQYAEEGNDSDSQADFSFLDYSLKQAAWLDFQPGAAPEEGLP